MSIARQWSHVSLDAMQVHCSNKDCRRKVWYSPRATDTEAMMCSREKCERYLCHQCATDGEIDCGVCRDCQYKVIIDERARHSDEARALREKAESYAQALRTTRDIGVTPQDSDMLCRIALSRVIATAKMALIQGETPA